MTQRETRITVAITDDGPLWSVLIPVDHGDVIEGTGSSIEAAASDAAERLAAYELIPA